jgi:hypothetical protein
MPSGRRFPLAFGTYTRRTGNGSQVRIDWCTRTAICPRAFDDRATRPSTPAVRRPALRCATWRTLSSTFDQERSIIFCSDRTCAQSCSRVALKILCRSRRTLPSWVRQSMASQSSTPSGPFTSSVSNLSLSSERPVRHQRSKAHLPHVSALSGPATGAGIRPVMPGRSAEEPTMLPGFPAAFRPPAFASWASCSRRGFRPSCDRPTGPDGPDPTGLPRSTHPRCGRIGRPLYPGASGALTTGT